jgi:hypothetical protein
MTFRVGIRSEFNNVGALILFRPISRRKTNSPPWNHDLPRNGCPSKGM